MALSVRDFKPRERSPELKNLGNVHVLVEDYVRDDQNRAIAVHGTNLKNGSDVVIKLADAERFARLYLNPNQDLATRVQIAEKQIVSRTDMREIGAARGNKAVPTGGVLSISNVRPDLTTGELYGRWPNAVVTDPSIETAMKGAFEIRTTLNKDREGKEFKTAFIQAYQTNDALPAEKVDRAALDKMLSGKLGETGAELRTNVAVALELDGETATYAFRPKMVTDDKGNYSTTKGVEQALAGKLTNLSEAVAAVAVAARADVPFDKLNIALPNTVGDKMDELRSLYNGVKDGSVPATFIPGATLQPSKFTVDAILGRKTTQEGVVEVKTLEQEMADRGFVHGIMGIRYISNESGAVVQPVVKAIFSDDKLPSKTSDYFVRHDLAAVGHQAFLATHESTADHAPKLGHMEPSASAAQKSAPVEPEDDLEEGISYGDDAPAF